MPSRAELTSDPAALGVRTPGAGDVHRSLEFTNPHTAASFAHQGAFQNVSKPLFEILK